MRDDLVAKHWPHVVALEQTLDDLDGRRVQINHTIEHVDRRETVTREHRDPFARLRRKHSEASL